jgi:hypothetical protein
VVVEKNHSEELEQQKGAGTGKSKITFNLFITNLVQVFNLPTAKLVSYIKPFRVIIFP